MEKLNNITEILNYPVIVELIDKTKNNIFSWDELEAHLTLQAVAARNLILCNINNKEDLNIYIDQLIELINCESTEEFESIVLNHFYIQILLELEVLTPSWNLERSA